MRITTPLHANLLIIGLFFLSFTHLSAKVDTVTTYSPSMQKDIKAVVITPQSYNQQQEYPVVYLLHGYSGNYRNWIEKVPALQQYADQFEMIIVTPDGNYGSWYLDSPVQEDSQYETYIARELTQWMDERYSTIKHRNGRAITGLSMGGHGAFYLSFRNQDVFGMAGSMSGGLDLRPFPNNWELSSLLGKYSEQPQNWENHSVINLTHKLTPGSLDLIFSCGTEDFFYQANVELHQKLQYHNIPHTFISAPGGHTWDFWEDTLPYHLQFFHTRFQQAQASAAEAA